MSPPRTLFEKIWQSHLVQEPSGDGLPATLAVDLHLLHEVTSPQAFAELEARGLQVRRPHQNLATMDHSTPTEPGLTLAGLAQRDAAGAGQLERLAENCRRHGIPLLPLGDHRQGIVHVIGPELGLTQPGMTIVCGDSHTSTHGAFGALAFGIGTSEVGHVLATQCLLQMRPRTFAIEVEGRLGPGVTAKDLILEIIATLGVDGGTGAVFEYRGSAIEALEMDGRMTVCNMSIEGGARAGLIAPDATTFDYLAGRPGAPRGDAWEAALASWRRLPSDVGASYDQSAVFDASAMAPRLTFGTNPGQSIAVDGHLPAPTSTADGGLERAFAYMGFAAGQKLLGRKIDVVFLGSCTNSRLTDLRAAAAMLAGRRVASNVKMLVVPGSEQVRRQAEAEGLAQIFVDAGAEWRRAGCSMCLAMNGDRLAPGQLAVSTSNRNFEGRQGPGGRTLLASPLTAVAAAVAGAIADPRDLVRDLKRNEVA